MQRSGFKKIITLVHLWLGLISGLVVFTLGLTGAVYAFSDDLKEFFYSDRLHVVVPSFSKKLPLEQLVVIAQSALGKDHLLSRAEIQNAPGRTYIFRALKVDKEALGYWNYYTYYYKAYIDPYTGRIVKLENSKKEFFTIVLAAHMNLLLGDKVGHLIVRYSVICFIILLLSGLMLWLPKNQQMIKAGLIIKFSAKFKRLNYDLHKVLGFYAILPLLLIALTGLSWSLNLSTEKKVSIKSDTTRLNRLAPHQMILDKTIHLHPATCYMLYSFPAKNSGTINVSAYLNNRQYYHKIQYKYDRYTGKLLETGQPFESLPISGQLIALNYDLHTGSALGLTGKILAFIASLIASSLPGSSFIYVKKILNQFSIDINALYSNTY